MDGNYTLNKWESSTTVFQLLALKYGIHPGHFTIKPCNQEAFTFNDTERQLCTETTFKVILKEKFESCFKGY